MATFDLPSIPEPRVGAHLLMGAASPLWAYYGAAAMGGMTYWLMTRWSRPVNLEALFGAAAEAAMTPVETALAAAHGPEIPVGGEAAPISPLVQALPDTAEPLAEAAFESTAQKDEPALEAAAEPADAAPPQPVVEPESPFVTSAAREDAPSAPEEDLAPRIRNRKSPPGLDAKA